MFFLQFEAIPGPGTAPARLYAGAYVNCWVDRSTLREAEKVAREQVAASGWRVKSLIAAHTVSRSDYGHDPQGLEYFEQAETDGEVFVFHNWPAEEKNGRLP